MFGTLKNTYIFAASKKIYTMFTLFKSSNQLVEEIHNEIDSAQDRLLNEAKKIIALQNADDLAKAERLERVGFVNSETVMRAKSKSIIESKEQAELIEYYKQNYPFQKFITEKEMDRICEKYNLVYAPVSSYKNDVPEKNLREIETVANLKDADNAEDLKYCTFTIDNSFWLFGGGDNWMSFLSKWRKILPRKIDGHFRTKYDVDSAINRIYQTGIDYIADKIKNVTINKQQFFIAAPQSHFNLDNLKQNGQYGFHSFSIEIVKPKDPIVFRYCRGGIQIITKWGLEASDEIVVNEKMN